LNRAAPACLKRLTTVQPLAPSSIHFFDVGEHSGFVEERGRSVDTEHNFELAPVLGRHPVRLLACGRRTSSALISSDCGITSPSARAVLRLTNHSMVVGSTARSVSARGGSGVFDTCQVKPAPDSEPPPQPRWGYFAIQYSISVCVSFKPALPSDTPVDRTNPFIAANFPVPPRIWPTATVERFPAASAWPIVLEWL
jgi:hypothetical protein